MNGWMNQFKQFCIAALVILLMAGCSSVQKAARCTSGKSNIKHKKFANKPVKKPRYTLSSGGSSSASVRSTPPPPPTAQRESQPEQPATIPTPQEEAPQPVESVSTPVNEPPVDIISEEQTPQYQIVVEDAPEPVAENSPVEVVPEEYSPSSESTPLQVENTRPTRTISVGKLDGPNPFEFDVNLEPGQFVFREIVYEKDEDFQFDQFIEFIPNHAIVKDEVRANGKIDDLVRFMEVYPDRKVTVVGNAGFDNWDEAAARRGDFDTTYNRWGEEVPVHYGRGPLIYKQELSVTDEDHLARLRREGVRRRYFVVVGEVMRERGIKIKKMLIERGIDPQRIRVALGEFYKSADRHVTFKIR